LQSNTIASCQFWVGGNSPDIAEQDCSVVKGFSTTGPQPGAWPWDQLYRAARVSPGIDN